MDYNLKFSNHATVTNSSNAPLLWGRLVLLFYQEFGSSSDRLVQGVLTFETWKILLLPG